MNLRRKGWILFILAFVVFIGVNEDSYAKAKKKKADGIVVLMTKFCDPEEFDYVPIKRAADEAGIPHINIEVDRQMKNYQQANTMLQTFADMLI